MPSWTITISSAISVGQITDWGGNITITGAANGTYTVATAVEEGRAIGSTLFTANAKPTATDAVVTYAFTPDGNPKSVASTTNTAGAVTLAGTLDYETAPLLVFKIV